MIARKHLTIHRVQKKPIIVFQSSQLLQLLFQQKNNMMETRLFYLLISVPSVVVGFASGNWNRKHNSFFTPNTSAHKHDGMRRGSARNIKVSFSVASSSSANDSGGEFTYLTNSNYNSLIHSSKPVLIDCCAQVSRKYLSCG